MGIALLAALCAVVLAVAAPASASTVVVEPTGGLPDVGAPGTYAAGDLPPLIRQYRESGRWDQDIDRVVTLARRYVKLRLKALAREGERAAVVFDVDETTLSNYEFWDAADFRASPVTTAGIVQGSDPAIVQTRRLYDLARSRGARMVFITGRPDALRGPTKRNLNAVGFRDYKLITRGADGNASVVPYKSGARRRLERLGYRIVANVGDQLSDLAGGFAERAFRIPNPMYFIP